MYFRKKGANHIYSNKDLIQFFNASPLDNDFQAFKKEFEQVTYKLNPKKNQEDLTELQTGEWVVI